MELEQVYRENLDMIERTADKLCRQFHAEHLRDDLVSAGTEALLLHAPEFDESRGASMSTFLYPHVRGAMKRELELLAGAEKVSKRAFEQGKAHFAESLDEMKEEQLASEFVGPENTAAHKAALEKMVLELIEEEFKKLGFREREIIGGRLEIFGYQKRTLASLAEEFQLSEDGVAKAYRRGMGKLRGRCLNGKPQELRAAFAAVTRAGEEGE